MRTRDSESIAGPDLIAADDVGKLVVELVANGRTGDPDTHTSGPIVRMRPRARSGNVAPMNGDALLALCNSLDFPMAVVTAFDGREQSGCRGRFSHAVQHHAASLAGLHLDREPHLSRRRALGVARAASAARRSARACGTLRRPDRRCGRGARKICIDRVARGAGGVAVLAGCDWVAGHVLERIELGDHVGHLLDIAEIGMDHPQPATQLGSQHARDIHPGHPA